MLWVIAYLKTLHCPYLWSFFLYKAPSHALKFGTSILVFFFLMVTFSNEEESTMEIFGQQVLKSFILFSVIIQSGIKKRSIS